MPLGAVLQSLIEIQGVEDRREQGAVCAAAPVPLSSFLGSAFHSVWSQPGPSTECRIQGR
jgi:hypothetical protein